MDIPPGLARLRRALLLHPADAQSWQALIDFIQSTGGGWLLSDLDGLFDDPIAAPQAAPRNHQAEVLEQGLELPSPQQADEAQADVFASRYSERHG